MTIVTRYSSKRLTLLVLPVLLVALTVSARGGEPTAKPTQKRDFAEYFRGKTIGLSVGYGPGGGADTQGRFLAVHMRKYLPGNPQILVQNRPGGGTVVNAEWLRTQAGNGLVIGQISNTLITGDLLGIGTGRFDWKDFIYLGQLDGEANARTFCGRTDRVKDLDDFRKSGKTYKMAYISPETSGAPDYEWVKILGMPIRIIYGYSGSTEVNLAFDRGEVDITTFCVREHWAKFPEWEAKDEVRPLFGISSKPNRKPDEFIAEMLARGKYPWFKDVRDFWKVSPVQDKAQAWYSGWRGNHVWVLPPNGPKDLASVYKQAFVDTANDPAFIADMKKARRTIDVLPGDDLRALAEGFGRLEPSVKDMLVRMHTGGR
jgi:hypothetical protein